jgi:hypothetical protein
MCHDVSRLSRPAAEFAGHAARDSACVGTADAALIEIRTDGRCRCAIQIGADTRQRKAANDQASGRTCCVSCGAQSEPPG